jgi:polysaccharide biosynthesis transport protein
MNHFDKSARRPAAEASFGSGLELWGEAGAARPSRAPDLAEIWLFLRRHLVWIVATTILVTLVCAIAVKLAFNQYSATATILFDPRNAKVTGAEQVLSDIGPDSIAIESLVQVAKSDGFLSALVDKLGLASDPEFAGGADPKAAALDKLRDRLTIGRRGATYVVDVSAKSSDAPKSARIANAAAAMIVDNESNLRSGSNQKAVDFIDGKLASLRDRVSENDAAIAKLRSSLKITNAGQGDIVQERRVAELNQQLVLASAHSQETRAIVEQLREVGSNPTSSLPPAIQSPVLNSLRQDYARLTREAADRETVLGVRHPDVVAANAQLNDVRRQIIAEKERLISSAKSDYLEARKREALLSDQLQKAQTDSGATDEDAVPLRELERNQKSDQAVYEQLLTRRKELSETRGLTSEDVRIVSAAIVPTRTNAPRLPLILAASGIIGLFAALASAFVRDAARKSLVTPSQVRRSLGIGTVAILPVLTPPPPRDGSPPEGSAARWFSGICLSPGVKSAARGGVILVASARSGEGASTVAANVAALLASGGSDVLLVQLSDVGGRWASRRIGILDVAAETHSLDRAVLWYGEDRPSLLPFGGAPGGDDAKVDALLSSAALRRVLRRCRRQFDSVILDAPALSKAPAIRSLAALADRALIVVEWDKTDEGAVAAALEGFDLEKFEFVLNKVDPVRYRLFASGGPDAPAAPAAFKNAAPVGREPRRSGFAILARSKARMGRRRSGAGIAG